MKTKFFHTYPLLALLSLSALALSSACSREQVTKPLANPETVSSPKAEPEQQTKASAESVKTHVFLFEGVGSNGLYRISLHPLTDQIPLNRFHSWLLHIERSDDARPVKADKLIFDGGMPSHGHGLPSKPSLVAGSKPGEYRIEGLKFSMRGQWLLNLAVQAEDGQDSFTIPLNLSY